MRSTWVGIFVVATAFGAAACGDDNSKPMPDAGPTDVHLDVPPTGAGFQFKTDSFEIPQGVEQQNCYFYQIPGTGTDPVYVHKFEVTQNAGSHHMNMFRVKTILTTPDGLGPDTSPDRIVRSTNGTGPCFKSPNWADWPLIVNSQNDGLIDWTLPDGVANKFMPGEWVMLQSHYVNAITQATDFRGHVEVNFWTIPAANVTAELGTLFATKQSIRICQSNPTPIFESGCQFGNTVPITIVGANGHFHSRGKEFDMYRWDGTTIFTAPATPPASDRFYVSQVWDEPPMMRTGAPAPNNLTGVAATQIPANGGVWYTCAYQWTEPPPSVGCAAVNAADAAKNPMATPDCCYTFGGIVEKSEHCNAFVYYYPKQDNISCN